MSDEAFKARAYVKEGCPFSFKFLVFMAEAGLLDRLEIVRLGQDDPDFEAKKAKLTEALGKSATFPTVEVEPGRYMSDSDRLIEHYAGGVDLRPDAMPVLSFYKQTIFPQLKRLHELESGSGKR